jgi:pyruvate dehydrogenase E2 component (dihydrolipoamide acetyltransferase)
MPIDITMPRLSDTMETGTVIKWNVSEGDAVASGDVVADVETDKATMELTVYDAGRIAKILVGEGQPVGVGTKIAVLAVENEDVAKVAASAGDGARRAKPVAKTGAPAPERPAAAAVAAVTTSPAPADTSGRMRVSPLARRLADEHRLDLRSIEGSGPGGRIIKRDVLKAIDAAQETAASRAPAAAPAAPSREAAPEAEHRIVPTPVAGAAPTELALPAGRRPLSGMRQTIARRLVESKQTIPHYQVTMSFDMDPLLTLRESLNEQLAASGVKLSVNDFLVRACALAMHRHPEVNASWDGDAIVVHGEVNVGIAIAVGAERGGGLVVGVLRSPDRTSLRAISAESKRLAQKARTRGLTVEEMTGATFTISNLGMYGVEHFTAIINPPNSAILAVGAALEKPVVRNGQLAVGREMSATLSSDHRVIDGAMAAEYLATLKDLMEHPATLLV